MNRFWRAGWFATAAWVMTPAAQAQASTPLPPSHESYRWITLGTMGGPQPTRERHEPANALARPGATYVVDAGDGVATQLVAAGLPIGSVKAIFVSHLHFDHVGGLFALLGLRNQQGVAAHLTIYGPPLTRQMVAGLLAAMRPGSETGFGIPGERTIPPETNIQVVELDDGQRVRTGDITVTAVNNTHYAGDAAASAYKSLSYRFDLPERSIVYTGDTGPSRALETMAAGADLLVSEVIDVDAVVAKLPVAMPPVQRRVMGEHLRDHHLSTRQVGDMARHAGIKTVVLTHIAAGGASDSEAPSRYVREVTLVSGAHVVMARDLQSF